MITTSIGHDRELSNIVKIYTNNIKYSGHNNNFTFKLAIFHDICSKANIAPKAKMKAFPTMLKGPDLANYSLNIDISDTAMNSHWVRYSIRKKWIKWDKTQDGIDKIKIDIGWRGLYQFLRDPNIDSLWCLLKKKTFIRLEVYK